MFPVTGEDLGLRLCEALGLDPKGVACLTVTCDPTDFAKVTVCRSVTDSEARRISEVLTEYTLGAVSGGALDLRFEPQT